MRNRKEEKRLKTNEESLRELWDDVKRTNIGIIGVPEGEEKEKETEEILQEILDLFLLLFFLSFLFCSFLPREVPLVFVVRLV